MFLLVARGYMLTCLSLHVRPCFNQLQLHLALHVAELLASMLPLHSCPSACAHHHQIRHKLLRDTNRTGM